MIAPPMLVMVQQGCWSAYETSSTQCYLLHSGDFSTYSLHWWKTDVIFCLPFVALTWLMHSWYNLAGLWRLNAALFHTAMCFLLWFKYEIIKIKVKYNCLFFCICRLLLCTLQNIYFIYEFFHTIYTMGKVCATTVCELCTPKLPSAGSLKFSTHITVLVS